MIDAQPLIELVAQLDEIASEQMRV